MSSFSQRNNDSRKSTSIKGVEASVINVKTSGWAVAEVSRGARNGDGVGISASIGELIAIHKKYNVVVGTKVQCIVGPNSNSRNGEEWFAISCREAIAYQPMDGVVWKPWQAGKECLALNLPDTVPGSEHEGICLACWRCGKTVIKPDHIHLIKNTAIWTNTDDIPGIKLGSKEELNKFKKCMFTEGFCANCKHPIASLYREEFFDSDTGRTVENREFPCFKVLTVRKKAEGSLPPVMATVLVGVEERDDDDAVRDSIDFSLTPTDEWNLGKCELPKIGRVDREAYMQRKKKLQEAGARPTKETCLICFDDIRSIEGGSCENEHYACRECFDGHVKEIATRPERLARGIVVTCPLPKCSSKPFSLQDIANLTSPEVFKMYKSAEDEEKEKKVGNTIRQEERERLEEEEKRRAAMDAEEKKVHDARVEITEEILTLKCPRADCRAAFVDFEGCLALKCSSCNCGFCACCLEDCGTDAHSHVASCKACVDAGTHGRYYGEEGAFERAQLKRRKKLVKELLEKHDSSMRSRIVDACRKDLEDVGMRDIVDKHFIVQRQEEPPAQGLGIMNPNRNGGGGAANENEMLALRMQMEEWSGGDMW
ncbi:hypothetical protein TrST_g12273 [Triparma strigata]|uniref:Uncharacterized protein n=1 Tax=Triparma strigata TaxID=1606541 RepID=A0A9W7BJ67_9STRA|nr:hypothetical protein TrST_g12273 [Triparma strigata]